MVLEVGTRPPGATVFVDGSELPPARLARVEVMPGAHLIRVVFPDGSSRDTTVTIAAGSEPVRVILQRN